MATLNILQFSDLHYRQSYTNTSNLYEKLLNKMTISPLKKLQTCVFDLNLEDYDIILFTGDLCDNGSVDDYYTLKQELQLLFKDKSIIVTLGNHDNKTNFYQGWFNETKPPIPFQQIIELDNYNIIAFDNSEFQNPNGICDSKRLKWLKEAVLKTQNKPTILMMHHQLNFEPGIVNYPYNEEFKQIIQQGQLVLILTGHSHHPYFGKFAGINYLVGPALCFKGENLSDNTVCFNEEYGYNLIQLQDQNLTCHKAVTLGSNDIIAKWHLKK